MTINLPLDNQRWPLFRMLTRADYGGSTSSGGGWQTEPLENPAEDIKGYILLNYSRALLPQLGTATLMYRYGVFNGKIVGASASSSASVRNGSAWNPASDTMDLPDLRGKEILIQANYPDEDGEVTEGNWKTVFWGTCEYQIDKPFAAATIPAGEITYHLVDAFHRTQRWFLNRHAYISNGVTISPAAGHPGYNVDPRVPAQVAGNRDPSNGTWEPTTDSAGIYGTKFVSAGAGNKWTDLQVLQDVLAIARPDDQPYWTPAGATDLLSQSEPWAVEENETVFSVVTRLLARGRGRGAALPDWTQSSPTGPITPKLTIFAQLTDTITYTNPEEGGGTVNFPGADSNGTSKTVDIIGDHRAVALQLGDAEQYIVDYLEVQGERIETMVTLEHQTTLEKGWTEADQTAFLALEPINRIEDKWMHVYTLHRLKRGFKLSVGDGNGGAAASADYRCTKTGEITTDADESVGESAISTLELLDDIPFFLAYTIDSGFVRRDGAAASAYNGTPQRMKPKMFIKTDDDLYITPEQLTPGIQVTFHNGDSILIEVSDDKESGERYIGDPDEAEVQSTYDFENVVFTVAFRSPHRARIYYGNPISKRKKIITVKNAHLWLLAPNAIYDLDSENEDADSRPARRASGGSPTVIRDDRNMIAAKAALAVAWYGPQYDLLGQNTVVHRGAQWTLACCGDIPTASDYDGGGVVYPKCGEVVKILQANGQRHELNSPVSSFIYDNTVGHSTWVCDWQDLDL